MAVEDARYGGRKGLVGYAGVAPCAAVDVSGLGGKRHVLVCIY